MAAPADRAGQDQRFLRLPNWFILMKDGEINSTWFFIRGAATAGREKIGILVKPTLQGYAGGNMELFLQEKLGSGGKSELCRIIERVGLEGTINTI